MFELNKDPRLNKISKIEQCEDKIIYLKDLRGQIPHNNIVTRQLKDADLMLVNQIKYWEKMRDSIVGNR